MCQPGLTDGSDGDERHICCTMSSVVLRLVRASGGESAVAQLLTEAGSRRDPAFLEHVDNWISLDEAVALLTTACRITGEPGFARRVGEAAVSQLAGTQVATLLRSLGSPEAVMRGITVTATKFSGITDLEAVDARPGWAEITSTPRQGLGGQGYVRHPVMCEWTKGLLSQPTVLFGLPPARVEESECQTQGATCCRYIVSWDAEAASADPEERVTALEAQMVAMSKRLDSAFATASELVSPDDLDTVLARIVERAASAVRAPRYVLAVRPTQDAEMRVYGHGFPSPAAQELAIDFVIHGDEGLAGPWAASAQPGDRLTFTGPGGGYNPDPAADWYLFAGDESALPAIGAAIESLPEDARGLALLEVDSDADIRAIAGPAGVELRWLLRGGVPAGESELLVTAVRDAEWLEGRVQVFAHGERGYMKGLREVFYVQRGLERAQVSLSGYWAKGRVEDDFQAEKKLPIGQI